MSLDASWQAVEQVNSKPETFVGGGVGTGAFDIGIIIKKTANTRIIIAIIIRIITETGNSCALICLIWAIRLNNLLHTRLSLISTDPRSSKPILL